MQTANSAAGLLDLALVIAAIVGFGVLILRKRNR